MKIYLQDISYSYTVTDKIEWTGNGSRYELSLIKMVLLLHT